MSYTSAIFYLDFEGGSDAARTALTAVVVTDNGSGVVRCTKVAHGLVSGAVGDATLNYVGAWIITVIDANTFDLVGSTYSTATALTFTPRGGSSKADAWKTATNGPLAARIAPGDTIRLMASPDETLVGNATWTNDSNIVTLAGANTAVIFNCDTVWTGFSANVTSRITNSGPKQGTNISGATFGSSFTTGKACYYTLPGGPIDFSAYEQVSFWWFQGGSVLSGTPYTIRLCSDTTGDVPVNTLTIPNGNVASSFFPVTIDNGSPLGSSIQSISISVSADPGTGWIYLDNIIACKASSAADSLTLHSLIGKVHNKVWAASTAYGAGAIRKPTQPNRNGLRYTASAGTSGGSEPTWPLVPGLTVADGSVTWTCEGVEDTWYAIQSINSTSIMLENSPTTGANTSPGYAGETETVATYKREMLKTALTTAGTSSRVTTKAGTPEALIYYSGGWDRTAMTTQNGETWFTGTSGLGHGMNVSHAYNSFENINFVRSEAGYAFGLNGYARLRNVHSNANNAAGIGGNGNVVDIDAVGVVANNNQTVGVQIPRGRSQYRNVRTENTLGSGMVDSAATTSFCADQVLSRNNSAYGINRIGYGTCQISNLTTALNVTAAINAPAGHLALRNASLAEATEFVAMTALIDACVYSEQHDATTNNHLITTDGGTIISATDQRNTASGISWKFRPTSTSRDSTYPLHLSIAKIACTSGVAVSVNIYTRRDNTNIQGQLRLIGGQIAGVPVDVTVACAPSINTWTNSSTLTFTPTEDGVVEILFEVWDGVGTTNNFWADDLTVA